jgi:hypothetical protein
MTTLLTPDTEHTEAAPGDPIRPTLDFPSMDPVRVQAQAEMRQKNLEAEWAKKVDRDKLDADKKAAWHRYVKLMNKQGFIDVLAQPPGWNNENWYEKFTEWELTQAGA